MNRPLTTVLLGVFALLVAALYVPVAAAQAAAPAKYWLGNTSSLTLVLTRVESLTNHDSRGNGTNTPPKRNNELPAVGTQIRPGATQLMLMENTGNDGNRVRLTFRAENNAGADLGNLVIRPQLNGSGVRFSYLDSKPKVLGVELGGQDIYVKDAQRTEVNADVPAYDADGQAQLLEDLCGNENATCRFVIAPRTPDKPNPISTRSVAKVIGGVVDNGSCGPIPNKISEGDTRTLTTSWSLQVSLEYSFTAAFKAGVTAAYSGSLSQATSFTTDKSMDVPVYKVGWWSSTVPVKRYTGIWTVNLDNTTWTMKEVTFDVPDRTTNSAAFLTPKLRDMTPQEKAVVDADRSC